MTVMTAGSLFSGIGGLDLGLERAGMEVIWQCEYDESARRILARHWPAVPCYPDVKELSGDGLADVDVLCGGFPCQDLSVAGRRAGLAGERSGLFHEFMRLASELAPGWVVIENVPGLLSSNDGRDMGTVVGTLAELGYGWAYRVLDAQYFGVAQRRRRVFIVGCAGGRADRAAQVLFEPESCDGDTPPSREEGSRVTQALTGGPHSSSCGNPDDNRAQGGFSVPVTAHCLTARERWNAEDKMFLPMAFMWQAGGNNSSSSALEHDMTPTLPKSQTVAVAYNPYRTLARDGSITSGFAPRPVVDALHGPTGNKEPLVLSSAYSVAVRGREDGQEWELGDPEVGNALRAGDSGSSRGNWALTPQMAVRRLLPVECERLQGFPDEWTAGESDSSRYARLGNAVAVPVAKWIGRRILEAA